MYNVSFPTFKASSSGHTWFAGGCCIHNNSFDKSFPSSRILYICAMSVEDCWYVLQYKVVNQFLKYNLRLGSVKVLSSDSCIYRSMWIVCNCSLKIQISEDIVTRHTCQTLLSMCMSVHVVYVSPCQSSQSALCLYCWQTGL